MSKFYITYGTDDVPNQPYKGGYSIVYAKHEGEARDLHQAKYGLSKNGLLRFCSCYTEKQFMVSC